MRRKSMTYDAWKRIGYNDDPARVNKPALEALTWDQLFNYYRENIQNQPLTVIIMGDPKLIDMKELKKIAKVKKVSNATLFAPIDFD